jgi:hypothetical protein
MARKKRMTAVARRKIDDLKAKREIVLPTTDHGARFNPFPVDAAEMLLDAVMVDWFEDKVTRWGSLSTHQRDEYSERNAQLRVLTEHAHTIRALERCERVDAWIKTAGVLVQREHFFKKIDITQTGPRSRPTEVSFVCLHCDENLLTLGDGNVSNVLHKRLIRHTNECALNFLIELRTGTTRQRDV